MHAQKTVTLTKCKIYNWNILSPDHIQLQLYDQTDNSIYSKIYLPSIRHNQITIRVNIKLTFSLEDKQIIVTLKNVVDDKKEQKVINFVVDFEKLTDEQNFFKTDFNNCIVNLVVEKSVPVQLPQIELKNKNQEIQSFIKQKEDFLQRFEKQFLAKRYEAHASPSQEMGKHSIKETPYFQKKTQESHVRNSQSSKIKQLIAKARDLRKEQLLINKRSQRFEQFYSSTYPSLSEMDMYGSEEKQDKYSYQEANECGNQQIQHYHEHKHIVCNNLPFNHQKNQDYPHQPRTNDSYSVYSSRSEQFLDNLHKNASESRLLDVKSPFKQRLI